MDLQGTPAPQYGMGGPQMQYGGVNQNVYGGGAQLANENLDPGYTGPNTANMGAGNPAWDANGQPGRWTGYYTLSGQKIYSQLGANGPTGTNFVPWQVQTTYRDPYPSGPPPNYAPIVEGPPPSYQLQNNNYQQPSYTPMSMGDNVNVPPLDYMRLTPSTPYSPLNLPMPQQMPQAQAAPDTMIANNLPPPTPFNYQPPQMAPREIAPSGGGGGPRIAPSGWQEGGPQEAPGPIAAPRGGGGGGGGGQPAPRPVGPDGQPMQTPVVPGSGYFPARYRPSGGGGDIRYGGGTPVPSGYRPQGPGGPGGPQYGYAQRQGYPGGQRMNPVDVEGNRRASEAYLAHQRHPFLSKAAGLFNYLNYGAGPVQAQQLAAAWSPEAAARAARQRYLDSPEAREDAKEYRQAEREDAQFNRMMAQQQQITGRATDKNALTARGQDIRAATAKMMQDHIDARTEINAAIRREQVANQDWFHHQVAEHYQRADEYGKIRADATKLLDESRGQLINQQTELAKANTAYRNAVTNHYDLKAQADLAKKQAEAQKAVAQTQAVISDMQSRQDNARTNQINALKDADKLLQSAKGADQKRAAQDLVDMAQQNAAPPPSDYFVKAQNWASQGKSLQQIDNAIRVGSGGRYNLQQIERYYGEVGGGDQLNTYTNAQPPGESYGELQ